MRENGWETETNEDSTYEELERELKKIVAEFETVEREDFDD